MFIILLFCASITSAQTKPDNNPDTLYLKKVITYKARLVNPKTGKVVALIGKKTEIVKQGYIVKQPSGLYLINGKPWYPDNIEYQGKPAH